MDHPLIAVPDQRNRPSWPLHLWEEEAVTVPGRLMDCRQVMVELGVKQPTAERIMQKLCKVKVDGVRKVFVERADLERLLRDSKEDAA